MIENNRQYFEGKNHKIKTPGNLSGVIKSILKSFGLTKDYNGWMVVDNWNEIVGDAIAKVAKPIRYQDGCIYVAVEDASWRQELAMQKEAILGKIHSYPYGASVKDIHLVWSMKGI